MSCCFRSLGRSSLVVVVIFCYDYDDCVLPAVRVCCCGDGKKKEPSTEAEAPAIRRRKGKKQNLKKSGRDARRKLLLCHALPSISCKLFGSVVNKGKRERDRRWCVVIRILRRCSSSFYSAYHHRRRRCRRRLPPLLLLLLYELSGWSVGGCHGLATKNKRPSSRHHKNSSADHLLRYTTYDAIR